jgi:hypothetical protein
MSMPDSFNSVVLHIDDGIVHDASMQHSQHNCYFNILPTDCAFLVLLALDGASLAALSSCSHSLAALTSGSDAAFVWRGVARADVNQLSLHERIHFTEPDLTNDTSVDHSPEDWTSQIEMMPPRPRNVQSLLQSSRQLYLLKLKQRRMAKQCALQEKQRIRLVRLNVAAADAAFVDIQVTLEQMAMVGTPLLLLASSLLLLTSDYISTSVRWAVFIPLWILIALLLTLGINMYHSRVQFAYRKSRERMNAAPPIVIPTVTTSASPSASHNSISATIRNIPTLLSLPPASLAIVSKTQQIRSEQALQRERRNQKFINSRKSDSHDAGQGPLTWLLDKYFDTSTHGLVNCVRALCVISTVVLLSIHFSLSSATVSQLPFSLVFLPLFVLFAYHLLYPVMPHWAQPSDSGSREEFAGSTLQFALIHTRQWLLWSSMPLLFFILLTVHVDSNPSTLTVAHVLIPAWIWLGGWCILLCGLILRFTIGLTFHSTSHRINVHSPTERNIVCPCRIVIQPEHRNFRLACTMITALLIVLGWAIFFALHAISDSNQVPTILLYLPLSISMLLFTLLASASAHQMRLQRLVHSNSLRSASNQLPVDTASIS